LPPGHGMTLFAIWAEFAAMNIGVAVGAILAGVGEHRLNVALRARHILVQAAQRITRLVVIEFGDGADRLPSLCRVTVLAGNVQIAVRAMSARSGALRRSARKRAEQKEQR